MPAAVWVVDPSVCQKTPTGRPYPSAVQAGPEGPGCNRRCVGRDPSRAFLSPWGAPIPPRSRQDRRDQGVTAVVRGEDPFVCPHNPHGASLSPRGLDRGGGTRVRPPLCGGGTSPCATQTPTGRPYPSVARAGPEGLGCNRRCVGGDFPVCP